MMTRDINRFKKNNKGKNKELIDKIKKGEIESSTIEVIFPTLNGLNNSSQDANNFNNIIEAREYLNNKEYSKNVLDTCKYILKENIDDLENYLGSSNYLKLKSSLTLFDYITNSEINILLTFRNYDKKLIKKIFTENKQFTIFKKILNKYYNGQSDEETILIIESEIFEYSQRKKILENINENYTNLAENILIKYSRISPLIISTYDKRKQKNKIKEFVNSLNNEEYILFSKFNINKSILQKVKINKNKIKEKIAIFSIIGIFLLSGVTIVTLKTSLSNDVVITNKVATETTKKEQVKESEQEIKENSIEETQEIIPENKNEVTEETKTTTKAYPYTTPTGNGNELVVQIALSQVGNIGGEIYWRWYGFSSRVPWCGIFVSWVANQAGVSTDIIPKFAKVSDGLNWFINRNLFRDRNYTPRSGDLIFFDYDYNGQADHVGIVEKVVNGKIYTVEGNIKNNKCHELSYNIGDSLIYGYGTPNY